MNNLLRSDSETVYIVSLILLGLTALMVLAFLITFFLLLFHKIRTNLKTKYQKLYTQWTIQYLLGDKLPQPEASLLTRSILKEVFIDLQFVLKGAERTALLQLYVENGFWDEDLELLRDPFWHKRLSAFVRLDLWNICLGAPTLLPLLHDPCFPVQQMAFKNLSRTERREEAKELMVLMTKHKVHPTVLYEAITNVTRKHLDVGLETLKDEKKKVLWPTLLKVLGDLRVLDSVPLLIERSSEAEAIKSLGQIGDPRAVSILKQSLGSTDPKIRLESLKALYYVESTELMAHKDTLLADSDPAVRSWMAHFMRSEA